jgi:hypothetical protein
MDDSGKAEDSVADGVGRVEEDFLTCWASDFPSAGEEFETFAGKVEPAILVGKAQSVLTGSEERVVALQGFLSR